MSIKEKESTAGGTLLIPEVGMGRLLYLDNLRSFALFLGILFHAAIVYAPKIGYAIQAKERADVFGYFCYYIHSFRMPLFYLISGYFSALVWQKKGMGNYMLGRIQRILIPMVLGLVFLAPIQYFLVVKIHHPNLSYFQFYPNFFSMDYFAHSHIWFLVDLTLFSILFFLFPKLWIEKIAGLFPKNENFCFLGYVILTVSLTILGHSFFPRGDDVYGIDKLTFIYQFGFFLVGILSFYGKTIFEVIERGSTIASLNWLLAGFVVFLSFYQLEISDPLWMPYFTYGIEKRGLHILLWCLSPFIWTKFFVLAFERYINVSNSFTVYLVDSSLPIYLLHHPISLLIAYYFREWDANVYLKFLLHTMIVFSSSFLIYDTLIKNTTILRKAFGLK